MFFYSHIHVVYAEVVIIRYIVEVFLSPEACILIINVIFSSLFCRYGASIGKGREGKCRISLGLRGTFYYSETSIWSVTAFQIYSITRYFQQLCDLRSAGFRAGRDLNILQFNHLLTPEVAEHHRGLVTYPRPHNQLGSKPKRESCSPSFQDMPFLLSPAMPHHFQKASPSCTPSFNIHSGNKCHWALSCGRNSQIFQSATRGLDKS